MTYFYKFRAYQVVNGLNVYSSYTGSVYSKPVLAVPAGLKVAKYTSSSFRISWIKGSEATRYDCTGVLPQKEPIQRLRPSQGLLI